ncbi:hypothetical protein [Mesorhizobium onobrychidis]|uniref:H repeat-associated protein N-terminal domain-containing protein n=1 Tax=Mesorhizobium onobrychidis TaxID=2775404 RepID=A0ABY5R502_9HYPH|nr:hypothetical protein [Mesorhizobium onobrychidis]UVC18580.1 hypothetical protein IHQ72_16800 [Mesorhizobium onobrychidis]
MPQGPGPTDFAGRLKQLALTVDHGKPADGSHTGHIARNRRPCDILLFVAALAASFGCVVSGKLVRKMPGWEVSQAAGTIAANLRHSLPFFWSKK